MTAYDYSKLAVTILLKNLFKINLFSQIHPEDSMHSVVTKFPLNSCITSHSMQCEWMCMFLSANVIVKSLLALQTLCRAITHLTGTLGMPIEVSAKSLAAVTDFSYFCRVLSDESYNTVLLKQSMNASFSVLSISFCFISM